MSVNVPEAPVRDLTDAEVAAYREDGAIMVSGLFSAEWVARLTEAVDFVLANPSLLTRAAADHSANRGTGDAFMWKTHQTFRDFVFCSPASRIAKRLFDSRTVTAFYDQIFAKPPGSEPSPFHEDASSFPVEGEQICAMWIALDPCGPDTAALKVVRGSHRWDRGQAPVVSTNLLQRMIQAGQDEETVTRKRANVLEWDGEDLLAWDMAPGDAVIFHPGALHGATGTGPDRERRAFASRWLGDDVTFQPQKGVIPILWDPELEPGDSMGGPLFPRVLPTPDESAAAWRPQEPDPVRLENFTQAMRRI
jgi:ectoine hydroxylase-related dioxygenase (phytanoyl-CoA dioxygenase family)